ncbi:hypothetical protein GIB67_019877 [Kingdonia uniflora]|uniref:Uncharacterized protein n=1 Tax=Kingdonia uniflora TaxID=39325 RepID=A0A7J7MKF2_9MAGN|nr:hypothetical protein GIB67_019877 [Kingdonia uniflora]
MLVFRALLDSSLRAGFTDLRVFVSSHQQLCFANSFYSIHQFPSKANLLTSKTHKSCYSSSAYSEANRKESISNFADLCLRDAGKLLEELKLLQKENERLNKLLKFEREVNVTVKRGNQSINDFVKRVEMDGELVAKQQQAIEELQIKIDATTTSIVKHETAIKDLQMDSPITAAGYTVMSAGFLCVTSSVLFYYDFIRKCL